MHNPPAHSPDIHRRKIIIGGRVQGVGMRPFIARLAKQLHLQGWVSNTGDHVEIELQGPDSNINSLLKTILTDGPVIARPVLISDLPQAPQPAADFDIRPSTGSPVSGVHVPPDYFTCDACLQELYDPANRRYQYPFINCTQCGPRYTIIRRLPYDRPHTTMADFTLCPECNQEYTQPTDRRYHAEPVACSQCGPQLAFKDAGHEIRETAPALKACLQALRNGKIVAVKGIGGYHLCCDATRPETINELRQRKHRPDKPLAVMFPQSSPNPIAYVEQYLSPSALEKQWLTDSTRPIVLIQRSADCDLPEAIAPGLDTVGAMLPYSPLHHLLLDQLGKPIIATSANLSGEPVLTDAKQVESRLADVADGYLHHDRPIERPADDSVMRVIDSTIHPLRLGRGQAPVELTLPTSVPQPLLACGGHMKNTIALAWERRIVISPHIGDLDSARSRDIFETTIHDLQTLYGIRAEKLVCDAHPGYSSSRWAAQQSLPLQHIYHHHAHAAACAGEFAHEPRWLVFTWDGVGLGEDDTLWGGEALLGTAGDWQRVASLRPFHLPGGDKAARQPWRCALALCWESGIDSYRAPEDTTLLRRAWENKLNCPETSAVGRLFDAAAALAGVCTTASYEGQGPVWLEYLARNGRGNSLCLPISDEPVQRIDWSPLVSMMTDDRVSLPDRAYRLHRSLADAIIELAQRLRDRHGEFAVGLSGGVFQNRLLSELALDGLRRSGFRAYLPELIPVNDGGLCYGQIIEAVAQ